MARIQKSRLIVTIVAITLLVAGGIVAMLYFGGIFAPRTETVEEVTVPATGKDYQPALREKEAKVAELIVAGGEQSIKEAEAIVAAEVAAAQKSGNPGYIVESTLAQTTLQTETGRAAEALKVLLELETQFADDPDNLNLIYAQISYAYLLLDDQVKANEYLAKIAGEGFSE